MKPPIVKSIIILIIFCFVSCQNDKPLPIIGNQPVADFQFVNQDSQIITNKTFDGKIYIANFFFTSCTTICPGMNRVIKSIFDEHKTEPNLMFLSHSIDFKYDTPERLKKYADKLGLKGNRWQFAHGNKSEIYSIAEHSYMSAVIEDNKAKENFIHQGYLLLVDKNRQLRGAYDSDNEEQVAQLKAGVDKLLRE